MRNHHENPPAVPAGRRRSPIPLLGPLLVLALLAVVFVPAGGPVGLASYRPRCALTKDIPDEAYAVAEFAWTHNYSPPPGLKGGKVYRDDPGDLPAGMQPYREFDVYPAVPGSGRPAPRVVLSERDRRASWYSPDHYATFIPLFPPECQNVNAPNRTRRPPGPQPMPPPKPAL